MPTYRYFVRLCNKEDWHDEEFDDEEQLLPQFLLKYHKNKDGVDVISDAGFFETHSDIIGYIETGYSKQWLAKRFKKFFDKRGLVIRRNYHMRTEPLNLEEVWLLKHQVCTCWKPR
jgi:hypothetical protein